MKTSSQHKPGAFAAATTLFFTLGFVTSLIDPLIPSVRAVFKLNYAESMLTQFTFFLAYAFVSLPGGLLIARLGYARSVIAALAAMGVGCLIMPLATGLEAYSGVLVGLFIIASGVTVLQVAANPLAALSGSPERSHFRLTLSQAFNSVGTVIGPFFGALLLLRGGVFSQAAVTQNDAARSRLETLRNIDVSFLIIAGLLCGLMMFIYIMRRRLNEATAADAAESSSSLIAAFRSAWALFGALAIFLYVGAEVSIGSLMINFLHQPSVLDVPLETASKLLMFYWFGAMIGRFIGSALLARLEASLVLSLAALNACLLCLLVTQLDGPASAVAALSVGLLNSIMFPTIFTLTLERSTATAAQTSGLLCMAIVGGAILPMMAGLLADAATLRSAFLIPMAAYGIIVIFAILCGRTRQAQQDANPCPAAAH
jgi:FHS family L-fucose permease-like MFS transporter